MFQEEANEIPLCQFFKMSRWENQRAPTTFQYRLTFNTGDYEWKTSMNKALDNKTKAKPI